MKNWVLLFIIALFSFPGSAQKQNKPNGTPVRTKINVNNLSTFFYNDGNSEIDPTGNAGTQYPSRSGLTAVFESGIVWGAKITNDPQVRVGGSTYRQGLQGGKIIFPGVAEDPNLPKNRIYRVRNDVYPGGPAVDLIREANDEFISTQAVRNQYETDWTEWPALDGAPYTDVNNNGIYDPATDVPGIIGAKQTIWYVANDLDAVKTALLYGTQPLGIEMQATIWNYDISGLHDNTIFKKYILINKSNTNFNDMFISQWSDPDVGIANDDFVGCDTMLNLGFAYNGPDKDIIYGLAPPVVGYDLLQGPIVQGIDGQDRNRNGINDAYEYAYLNGRLVGPGYINLLMTAFYYFTIGDSTVIDPTMGDPVGSTQFYNYLQGKVGLTGEHFLDPTIGSHTNFAFAGDPISRTGWLDGMLLPSNDRKMGLSAGPFNMAPHDTQEVIIAEIIAGGKNRINGFKMLKYYDSFAQRLYDSQFSPPASLSNTPLQQINATYSSSGINLEWNQNYGNIENYNYQDYAFQGYNVYQLYSPIYNSYNGKKIATFDIVDNVTVIWGYIMDELTGFPTQGFIQNGSNSGIQRQLSVNTDYIAGGNLRKGKPYYYAVSYYAYNQLGYPESIEVFTDFVEIIYQDTIPGINYGDTISVHHLAGNSRGNVNVIVDDPAQLTGHNYSVLFTGSLYSIRWSLKDNTTNTVVSNNNELSNEGKQIDGFIISVSDSPWGMAGWEVPNGIRNWTYVNADKFYLEGFEGAIGNAYNNWFSSSTVGLDNLKNVLIRFVDADTGGTVLNPADPNVSFAYRYLRHAEQPPALPQFAPFIVNPTAGYAYQDYIKNLYWSAYDMETNPPRRLSIGHIENNVVGGRVNGKYDPPTSFDGIDNVSATGPREWFFIFDVDYSETPDAALTTNLLTNIVPMMWFGTVNRNGTNSYHSGDEFLIVSGKPYTSNDVYTFNSSVTFIEDNVNNISYQLYQNYPNPFNPTTTIRFSIPERTNVLLEVFNILGQKVTTLVNTELDKGNYQREFNASKFASGVYIYRIQAGNFITSKKLLLLK